MREHESSVSDLTTMEQTLREELQLLAAERQQLVTKEKNLIEAEKSLATVFEATGIEWEEPAPAPREVPLPPPKAQERPPAPEPTRSAPPPPPPKHREAMEQEFEKVVSATSRAGKSEAIEKMNRALEMAKKARDAGNDVSEVRRILKQARTAFENQNWEEAVRLSDQIVEMLASLATASR